MKGIDEDIVTNHKSKYHINKSEMENSVTYEKQ